MVLLRALAATGPAFALTAAESRDWSSATFTGERHRLRIELADDPATTAWLDALPEAELTVRGRLVADMTVTEARREGGRVHAAIEALTIADS